MSKRRWIALETLLTFWPPAPCARMAVISTSDSGMTVVGGVSGHAASGCRGDQRAGVVVARRIQHLQHGARLTMSPSFITMHLVRHGPDHVHVVGDQQVAQAAARVCSRCSSFSTCFWIVTSSALVGSSSTSSCGSTISARAMARRWRWPPENSCG